MRLIIAGSRDLQLNSPILTGLINQFGLEKKLVEVVCGKATGVDAYGDKWARDNGHHVRYFPAWWTQHGKAAGPIRNREMAEYADALLLIWDGESPGSKNMKSEMLKLNKPVYEVILRRHNVEP